MRHNELPMKAGEDERTARLGSQFGPTPPSHSTRACAEGCAPALAGPGFAPYGLRLLYVTQPQQLAAAPGTLPSTIQIEDRAEDLGNNII
jgi:hypothetical protein